MSSCRGMSYTGIVETRKVKVVTIRNTIYAIQIKVGVDSKHEVVAWAFRNGLLDDCTRAAFWGASCCAGQRLPH